MGFIYTARVARNMSDPLVSSTMCPISQLETGRPSQSATVKEVQGLFFYFFLCLS